MKRMTAIGWWAAFLAGAAAACTDVEFGSRAETIEDTKVQVQVDFPATGVYTASPDGPSLEAQTVPYTVQTGAKGCFVAFELPAVEVWRIVWIEMKGGNEDEK